MELRNARTHEIRQRRGDTISGIGRLRWCFQAKDPSHHELYLFLGRTSAANDSTLDLCG